MSWKKMVHGLVKPDWVFAILLVASGTFLFMSQSDLEIGGGLAVSPMIKGLLVFGLVLLVSFLSTIGISLDRKLADDYYFQLMANGAIVGIITNLMIVAVFVLFKDWLPALTIKDIFSTLMAGWSLGYFFYRWRGLKV
jgi:hypothetical protein